MQKTDVERNQRQQQNDANDDGAPLFDNVAVVKETAELFLKRL